MRASLLGSGLAVVGLVLLTTPACTSLFGSFTAARDDQDGGLTPGAAGLTVEPPVVDFGLMDCGGAEGSPQTVTVRNTGTAQVEWVAALEGTGSVFELSGTLRGALAPGAEASFAVTAKAVDPALESAGSVATTLLRVAPPGATDASSIRVRRTARGPQFELVPGEMDFGKLPPSKTRTLPLRLRNVGNAGAAVRLSVPPSSLFTLLPIPDQGPVPPGGELDGQLRFDGSDLPREITDEATLAVLSTARACRGSTSRLPLKAVVSTDPILPSPGKLDFGRNQCGGSAPAAQTIQLATGAAAGSVSWRVRENPDNVGFVLSKTSGTMTPSTPDTLTVTPVAIPVGSTPGPYAEDLVLETTTPLGVATINLTELISGAVIGAVWDDPNNEDSELVLFGDPKQPAYLNLPYAPKGSSSRRTLYFVNAGNEQVELSLAVDDRFGVFGIDPRGILVSPYIVEKRNTVPVVFSFVPSEANTFEAPFVARPSGGALCTPSIDATVRASSLGKLDPPIGRF